MNQEQIEKELDAILFGELPDIMVTAMQVASVIGVTFESTILGENGKNIAIQIQNFIQKLGFKIEDCTDTDILQQIVVDYTQKIVDLSKEQQKVVKKKIDEQ